MSRSQRGNDLSPTDSHKFVYIKNYVVDMFCHMDPF